MKTLDFTDPYSGQKVSAKWSHLINELKNSVKLTKLSYSSLYPTNFEKQKVSLAMNIFNEEKTVAALDIRKYDETKMFVEAVTRLWHILNVKTPHDGVRLNDEDRTRVKDINDERLTFLVEMAKKFAEMNTSSQYKSRIRCLTVDTSKALYLTLIGLVDMVKMLLVDKIFEYVLTGEFQNDRLEGEFGVMRQISGGKYYISYEQLLSSLKLRRIKLFIRLVVPYKSVHENESCCEADLNDEEVDLSDKSFELANSITVCAKSALYYISRYVAMKEGIGLYAPSSNDFEDLEFTNKVSRGLLFLNFF